MNAPTKFNHAPAKGDLGKETAEGWRSQGIDYQSILDADTVQPVKPILRETNTFPPGVMKVPVDRYLSQEIHNQEVEKIWKKVWQMACREEDIPNVGDYIVYDIADLSWIIVKTGETDGKGEYKALRNACLHRGRKLKEGQGRKAKEFRCFFHGWSWEINGDLKNLTCPWDFPGLNADNTKLPQAKTATWKGWVFMNMDENCEPFEDYIGTLSDHFTGCSDHERRYKRAHVIKMIKCNWKVAQEAFMEAYHVVMTHPHVVAGTGDSNAQYDAWGNFARGVNASGYQSPHIERELSQQELLDNMTDAQANEAIPPFSLPDGWTARAYAAQSQREDLRTMWGDEVDTINDAEFDSYFFTLFPNFHPWSGFSRINYRFRPYGNNPDECIMEVMMLDPFDESKPRPPPGRVQFVDFEDGCDKATDLGGLARLFAQDEANMPKIQLGMKAMNVPGAKAEVQYASYAESKIKHFHTLWNKWMGVDQ